MKHQFNVCQKGKKEPIVDEYKREADFFYCGMRTDQGFVYEFVNEEDNLSVDITFMTQLQGMSIVGHDDSVNMFTL